MEPELFSEIESTLWKNFMVLSENNEHPADYLRGYFCACEDLAFIFSRLEQCIHSGRESLYAERKEKKIGAMRKQQRH